MYIQTRFNTECYRIAKIVQYLAINKPLVLTIVKNKLRIMEMNRLNMFLGEP